MTNWRTNLGGAISVTGISLTGVGVLSQLTQLSSSTANILSDKQLAVMWYIAASGFVLSGIGKGITALFAADAAAVKSIQAQLNLVPEAIDEGDTTMLKRSQVDTQTTGNSTNMKNIVSLLILTASIAVTGLFAGCGTAPIQITPSTVQTGVQTAVSVGVVAEPVARPYVQAVGAVICSEANSTNLSPAAIVAAINASDASVLKNPEGVIVVDAALGVYNLAWNSLTGGGTNAVVNITQVQPYLLAVCNGITDGLPMSATRMRNGPPKSVAWPMVTYP